MDKFSTKQKQEKEKTEAVKFFDVSRGENSTFYFFNATTNCVFKVTKSEFKMRDGKVFTQKHMKVKAIGDNTENMRIKVHKLFSSFKGEGLHDFLSGIKLIVDSINSLGFCKNFISTQQENIVNFLISLGSLFVSFLSFGNNGNLALQTMVMCKDLYLTFVQGNKILKNWKGETLNTAILAAISLALPSKLSDILRRMSLLSSSKLCDDVGGFYTLFTHIVDFIKTLVNYLPFTIPDNFILFFSSIFDLRHHLLLHRIDILVKKWKGDRKLITDGYFQKEIIELRNNIDQNTHLLEWERRSNAVKIKIGEFKKLVKSYDSYNKASRLEPCCFIFEGPPRTLKSVLMSKLVSVLNKSVYAHTCKASNDGKDFYDTYNAEEVFLMDDVGQQGVSQWRNIINMVAPIKLPLDCAAADLKDTKFFDSSLIMLTTNNFQHLDQGLTRADGIENIQALWRRGYVFDFSKVTLEGNAMKGYISFKHFDVKTGWKSSFDKNQMDFFSLNSINISPSIDCSYGHNNILAWMKVIVINSLGMKNSEFEGNVLTDADKSLIERLERDFYGESWSNTKQVLIDGLSYSYELINKFIKNIVELVADYINSIDLQQIITDCISHTKEIYTKVKEYKNIYSYIFCYVFGTMVGLIGSYFLNKKQSSTTLVPESVELEFTDKGLSPNLLHPSVNALKNQTFDIEIIINGVSVNCVGILSGRKLITVGHVSQSTDAYLIVYKDRRLNNRLIDNIKIERKFLDLSCDISVWSLPTNYPSPFKNISNYFMPSSNKGANFLINPLGVISIDKIKAKGVEIPTPYVVTSEGKQIKNFINSSDVFYKVRYPGMCGSIVTDDTGHILAMHVAGNSTENIGVAIRIPDTLLLNLAKLLDSNNTLDLEFSDSPKQDFSGIKFRSAVGVYTPKNTNYIKTPLYNVFPISRVPANLSMFGSHTVKDVAKKSFKPVVSVNQEEIDFGKKIVAMMLPTQWGNISLKEVINGNSLLTGLNKHSSNGFNCPPTKADCIDYERGLLTPEFQSDYEEFLNKVEHGKFNCEDIACFETLKDELRTPDKMPRSFRVSRLHMQILTKTCFGAMVEHIVRNRKQNQIMIGVNPYTEWDSIYSTFSPHKFWAGDIKSWDGSMLPQVQHAIYEIFKTKYTGNKKHLDCITGFLNYCLVIVNDDLYLTTHSMPSGSFLTAILNSLVNRFYTAMWFYRECTKNGVKPTVALFDKTVIDFVYGDDKLNAIKGDYPFLNAISMKNFFLSIGMDFTDSKKGEINTPYQTIKDVTFLKREFVYHKKLMEVVGPLDLQTIYSGLSWFDKKKDTELVLQDKMHAFQREMFLHEHLFDKDVKKLKDFCIDRGIQFTELPFDYLFQLYKSQEFNFDQDLYGILL